MRVSNGTACNIVTTLSIGITIYAHNKGDIGGDTTAICLFLAMILFRLTDFRD